MSKPMHPDACDELPTLWNRSYSLAFTRAMAIAMRRLEVHYTDKYGLDVRSVWVMMAADEKPSSQKFLSMCLHINNNVMVGIVDRLEERKLLTRKTNPENRREHILELTTKGKEMLKIMYAHFDAVTLKAYAPVPINTLMEIKKHSQSIIDHENKMEND